MDKIGATKKSKIIKDEGAIFKLKIIEEERQQLVRRRTMTCDERGVEGKKEINGRDRSS